MAGELISSKQELHKSSPRQLPMMGAVLLDHEGKGSFYPRFMVNTMPQ